jgi:hypothetical protein
MRIFFISMMGKVLNQNDGAYRELLGANWQVFQSGDLSRVLVPQGGAAFCCPLYKIGGRMPPLLVLIKA